MFYWCVLVRSNSVQDTLATADEISMREVASHLRSLNSAPNDEDDFDLYKLPGSDSEHETRPPSVAGNDQPDRTAILDAGDSITGTGDKSLDLYPIEDNYDGEDFGHEPSAVDLGENNQFESRNLTLGNSESAAEVEEKYKVEVENSESSQKKLHIFHIRHDFI
jgi:hypothetical protein